MYTTAVSYTHLSNRGGDNETRKLVGISNGVVISIDELEEEWRDRLNVEGVQRVKFYCDGEAETTKRRTKARKRRSRKTTG